jgi:hypothetical protein
MSETLNQRVNRVRRQVEVGIAFATENGITVKPQVWMNGTQACAIGCVFHQRKEDMNLDLRLIEMADLEMVTAARALKISKEEVTYFISGFDNESYYKTKPTPRREAMLRLGARLRKKYVPVVELGA